jgi:hypothetical protein
MAASKSGSPSIYFLPVRLLRSDDKDNEVELSVLSIAS